MVRYADKIAYMNHDIDDAIRAGVLAPEDIPEVPPGVGETKSERITAFVTAVVEHSGQEIAMDEKHQTLYEELRKFMFEQVYTNPIAKKEEEEGQEVVRQLYQYFATTPQDAGRIPRHYGANRRSPSRLRLYLRNERPVLHLCF